MRADCTISCVAILALALSGALAGCSAGDTHADSQTPVPPPISYISSWGVKGDEPGHLDEPTCIATDVHGNAYLADAGSHFVHKFDSQGHPLLSFEEDVLKHPQSIAIDSGGAIYVADSGRGSAFVYMPGGDKYHELRLKIRPNAEDMLSVAVGDDGRIHVLDADAGKIFTYTPRFRLAQTWAPSANVPNTTVRPEAIAVGPDNYLYVSDPPGNRILRFTRDGHFVAAIGGATGGVDRRLSGEFAVSSNSIFAMDADGRTLHAWSLDGRPKLDVDLAPELGQGARSAPALAISPRKELLVLDAPESHVLRYHINF